MEAAAADRALTQKATRPLGELGAGRPADVAALRALVERGAALVGADCPAIAAAQAFHLRETHFHNGSIGRTGRPVTPIRGMPSAGLR